MDSLTWVGNLKTDYPHKDSYLIIIDISCDYKAKVSNSSGSATFEDFIPSKPIVVQLDSLNTVVSGSYKFDIDAGFNVVLLIK